MNTKPFLRRIAALTLAVSLVGMGSVTAAVPDAQFQAANEEPRPRGAEYQDPGNPYGSLRFA